MKLRQKTMQGHISIHVLKGGIREIERTNIRDPVGKHKGIKENKKGKEIVFPSHPNRMRKI